MPTDLPKRDDDNGNRLHALALILILGVVFWIAVGLTVFYLWPWE